MTSSVVLNDAQRAAVEHAMGPLLVLAGAGSGKTRVLTERVGRLLESGLTPDRLLAFTFTNRAAREMRERIERRVSREPPRRLWVGTFHGTGLRILRREARREPVAGRGPDFVVYDREDQEGVLKEILKGMGMTEEAARPGEILGKISDAKSALVTPAEAMPVAMTPFQRRVTEAYALYEEALRKRSAFDFDDLIAQVVWLFRERPQVAEYYAQRFEHVLVDEYQDTNHAQFRVVEALGRGHNNVFVVGDDDQCLAEGSRVTMADGGRKPIEEVRPFDLVMSALGSGRFAPRRVLRVHRREACYQAVEIVTRSGKKIVSTPEHTHFAGYLPGVSPQVHFGRARDRGQISCRRNVVVTLCGESRGAKPMHRISIVGNDSEGRAALQRAGLRVRAAKKGSRSWRHETARSSFAEIQSSVATMQEQFPLQLHLVARLGRSRPGKATNSLPFIPAGSVLPGMAMFDEQGEFDVVTSVRRVQVGGPFFDLDIEGTHNFIANGLVTHNSIYGWRNADITNILDFERAFPGSAVIKLEQNYRSTGNILAAANAVIENNRDRKGKRLWCEREAGAPLRFVLTPDETEEARRVVQFIHERALSPGATHKLSDCAVLYRTHAQSRALETELRHRRIPYELVGGISFYQRREVKDLLAYLRLAINPTDTAAFWRALNTPKRGLGDAVRARLDARLQAGAENLVEALRASLQEGTLSRGATSATALLALLDELRARSGEPADVLLKLVLERTGYLDWIAAEDERLAMERVGNVQELLESAAAFAATAPEPGLAAYLAEAALLTDADRLEEGADRLLLLTAHNAKGLEFNVVVVAGLEEGLFPHASSLDIPSELEEERRLFYVAMTRAKDQVLLTAAAFRHRYTAGGYGAAGGQVSRFVDEIPRELLDREEPVPTVRDDDHEYPSAWKPRRGPREPREWDRGGPRASWTSAGPTTRSPAVGREVYHESFGRGVVMAAEGQGDTLRYTVRFGTRIKKVLARFLTEGSHVD